jgi:hypothetical protein
MALRRLGWGATAPAGVVVSDRVRRIAEEEAGRALRLAVYRRSVTAVLIATWPADPVNRTDEEWSALRVVLPDGVDNATIRNRTRQIAAFAAEYDRLPADLCDLEDPPTVARQVSLAAADRPAGTRRPGRRHHGTGMDTTATDGGTGLVPRLGLAHP